MKFTPTDLPEVMLIEPEVFRDDRGFFFESFNSRAFQSATGCMDAFVQDDHSRSTRHVLRGLHYQIARPQGKIVRVVTGEIFDVAVDLRKSSPNFGRWVGTRLGAENRRALWIPRGFAHGFLTLSETAEVLYKHTDFWSPEHQRCIRWDDPATGIKWPLSATPILSAKDAAGSAFKDAELFP
ncbi:MAG: dTDP-4-dehydrorhamnose 3,5-epimerase [Planctomycetes bacterium]|nr:dTDP-4-dehydrorhamnose 3,5-epimerase [Planctomycetota bacterium]